MGSKGITMLHIPPNSQCKMIFVYISYLIVNKECVLLMGAGIQNYDFPYIFFLTTTSLQ